MQIKVLVRFYEELNDYLEESLRKRDIELNLPQNSTVEDILKRFKIPVNEVHLVLINGKNSSLKEKLHHEDRLSIYPIFESIDITPIKIIKN